MDRSDIDPHTRRTTVAKRLWQPRRDSIYTPIASIDLDEGDYVLVEAGDIIPGDGKVVEGAAPVDEAAITGESAPVIHGYCRCNSVTGGTRVVSDWLIVRITVDPGERPPE